MPEMIPVPVLIPAYKDPEALARCVNSIPPPGLIFIHHNEPDNLGFTGAVNLLLDKALSVPAPYAIIINQDVRLMPDTIRQAVAFMAAYPRCAIAGFKQLAADDPDLITHGGTGAVLPGEHLTGRVKYGDCAFSRPMRWVNGAAMIVRMAALAEIGLMDARFFLFCSDSDWCLTARRAGWDVWYCAEAVCLHGQHGCSREPTAEQAEIMAQDQAAFTAKWLGILRPANNRADRGSPGPFAPQDPTP